MASKDRGRAKDKNYKLTQSMNFAVLLFKSLAVLGDGLRLEASRRRPHALADVGGSVDSERALELLSTIA